jgi:polyadenylate-binding protein
MHTESGESLGFGFVCFREKEAAHQALTAIDGQDGLYVRKALKKAERLAEIRRLSDKFRKSMLKFNLYVKNIPLDSTEEELHEYFSKFGLLKNVKIMHSVAENGEPSKNLGFGFVSFDNSDSAARAKLES